MCRCGHGGTWMDDGWLLPFNLKGHWLGVGGCIIGIEFEVLSTRITGSSLKFVSTTTNRWQDTWSGKSWMRVRVRNKWVAVLWT